MKYLFLFSFFFSYCYSQESKSFFKKKSSEPVTTSDNSSSIKPKSFFKKKNNIIEPVKIEIIKDTISVDSLSNINLIENKDSIAEVKNISFLDSPVEDAKITSGYSKRRFHPVLKKWQEHNGTDFAAAYGSKIKATAGGVVEVAGYTNGNGNFVKIKHNSTYTTQYLHMSKILVAEGQTIKLGQEIGLVGSSGLATGPHVCYRFWKNGIQVDPFSLDFSEETKKENDLSGQDAAEVKTPGDSENEKEFKTFVSGFFKKKNSSN